MVGETILKALTFSSWQALNCAEYSIHLTLHSLLPLSLSLKPFPHLHFQLIILFILLRKLKQSIENIQGLPPSHLPTSIYTHICCFLNLFTDELSVLLSKAFLSICALDSIPSHLKNFAKSPLPASLAFFTFYWIIPIKSMLCFLPSEEKKSHKNLFMCFNSFFGKHN